MSWGKVCHLKASKTLLVLASMVCVVAATSSKATNIATNTASTIGITAEPMVIIHAMAQVEVLAIEVVHATDRTASGIDPQGVELAEGIVTRGTFGRSVTIVDNGEAGNDITHLEGIVGVGDQTHRNSRHGWIVVGDGRVDANMRIVNMTQLILVVWGSVRSHGIVGGVRRSSDTSAIRIIVKCNAVEGT